MQLTHHTRGQQQTDTAMHFDRLAWACADAGRCLSVVYCSKDCQVASWRQGHKQECALVVSAVEALSNTSASESEHEVEREAHTQGPAANDAHGKAGSDAHRRKGHVQAPPLFYGPLMY